MQAVIDLDKEYGIVLEGEALRAPTRLGHGGL